MPISFSKSSASSFAPCAGHDRDVHVRRLILSSRSPGKSSGPPPQRIIPAPVKGAGREAAKITNPRQGRGDEPIEEPYIASRRSVTRQPIGTPSRSLKLAMLWRDLLVAGLRPVISARSLAASSTALFKRGAHPHVDHDLLHAGHLVDIGVIVLSFSTGTTS